MCNAACKRARSCKCCPSSGRRSPAICRLSTLLGSPRTLSSAAGHLLRPTPLALQAPRTAYSKSSKRPVVRASSPQAKPCWHSEMTRTLEAAPTAANRTRAHPRSTTMATLSHRRDRARHTRRTTTHTTTRTRRRAGTEAIRAAAAAASTSLRGKRPTSRLPPWQRCLITYRSVLGLKPCRLLGDVCFHLRREIRPRGGKGRRGGADRLLLTHRLTSANGNNRQQETTVTLPPFRQIDSATALSQEEALRQDEQAGSKRRATKEGGQHRSTASPRADSQLLRGYSRSSASRSNSLCSMGSYDSEGRSGAYSASETFTSATISTTPDNSYYSPAAAAAVSPIATPALPRIAGFPAAGVVGGGGGLLVEQGSHLPSPSDYYARQQ